MNASSCKFMQSSHDLHLALYPLRQALTCFNCRGILQNPACLPCNHHFCMSCLLQSVEKISACARCKQTATKHQVKLSPDMANIVVAYQRLEAQVTVGYLKEMNGATDEDFCLSLKRSRKEEPLSSPSDSERSAFKLRKSETSSSSIDAPYRGVLPASKRVQLPQPIDIQGSFLLEEKCEDFGSNQSLRETVLKQSDMLASVDKQEKVHDVMEDEPSLMEGLASTELNMTSSLKSELDPNTLNQFCSSKLMPCKVVVENGSVSQTCSIGHDSATLNATLPKAHDARDEKQSCAFCHISDSPIAGTMIHFEKDIVVNLGGKKTGRISCVHKNCAEWAPDVYYVDDVAKNIPQEVVRGHKIKCHVCGLRGAVLGCYVKRCRKSFHYPCAHSLSCRWDHDNFLVLCPEHIGSKFPGENAKGSKSIPVHDNPASFTPEAKANNVLSVGDKPEANVSTSETPTPYNADLCSDVYVPTMEVSSANEQSSHNDKKSYFHLQTTGVVSPEPGMVEPREEWPRKWATSQLVLCGSGLSTKENDMLASLARHTGFKIQRTWAPCITHLIVGTDGSGAARRTFKYLMATLEGKWILKADWLYACMAAGRCVNEESYEVSIDVHGMLGGPRHARSMAVVKACPLFRGLRFYFLGHYDSAYRNDLEALLTAAGGAILHSIPDAPDRRVKDVVIFCTDVSFDEVRNKNAVTKERYVEAKSFASLIGAEVVGHTWILDSIAAYRLQPFE